MEILIFIDLESLTYLDKYQFSAFKYTTDLTLAKNYKRHLFQAKQYANSTSVI